MTTRIHIGRAQLEAGEPAIVVEQGRITGFGTDLAIEGPSRVVQDSRGMPGDQGVRRKEIKCWIETDSPTTFTVPGDHDD